MRVSPSRRPLTVGLFLFATLEADVDISATSEVSVIVIAPLLIGFLIFQCQYMQAFLSSGVK